MPTKTTWIAPEVFLEHNGVTVYHTYQDNDYEAGPMEYWFTLNGEDDDDDDHFDVRDLDVPSRARMETEPGMIKTVIREAIDLGILTAEFD